MLWRHGDVLVAEIKGEGEGWPQEAQLQNHTVLAKGEVTGHSHQIAEPGAARLWQYNRSLFLEVVAAQATLVHEEHKPIVLPKGKYKVWIQREYTPTEIRRVVD